MNRHLLPDDISQDALVGGRRSPNVVFRLQSIDGYDYVQTLKTCPACSHGAEGAGYNLHVDSTAEQEGNQQFQLAKADQGVATDNRQVHGLQPVDHLKDSVYQGLASAIVQFA